LARISFKEGREYWAVMEAVGFVAGDETGRD
jgi:hypothetical protein